MLTRLLFFVGLLVAPTSSLYFHIAETERKCFIEEIPDETMVIGNYKVQLYDPNTKGYGDYPNIGMHVEVKDPDEKVILSKLYTSEGRFTFTSHTPGEHLICLYSNSSAWFSGAQLRVHLDLQVGEHAQDYAQVAAKDKLNELQLRIRQLLDQVEQITKEQNYQRYREERFRVTSESTNSRVLWWSIAQTLVLVVAGQEIGLTYLSSVFVCQLVCYLFLFALWRINGCWEKLNGNRKDCYEEMVRSVVLQRLSEAAKNGWVQLFSGFAAAYGAYNFIDMTASGKKYDLPEDLAGRTYIVTGATSGIGKATTEELAKRNARVIMACRDRTKCIEVRRNIVLATKNKQIFCRMVDLSDFESIKEFAAKVTAGKIALDRIDGLINNAATMDGKREVTKMGIENMLATNYLGTFLLTGLLLPKLLQQPHKSRIVFVNTNVIDKVPSVDLEDLNSEDENRKFDSYERYKWTKLATAMFAYELAERLKGSNISVLMTDPGRTRTNLTSQLSYQNFFLSRWIVKIVGFVMGERRVEKATRPIMYAAADPEIEGQSKVFFNREREPQKWNHWCEDKDLRNRLWLVAEKWTNYREMAKQIALDK
ncbi:GOLD domain-containing protein [Aphelenchoides besseyi]|nr:GOLD domain-containing protein [Aphelenchoides besseyi]